MDDRWESEVMEYGAVNITGFRIVDMERPIVKQFLSEWAYFDVTPQNSRRQSISVSISILFFIKISNTLQKIQCRGT